MLFSYEKAKGERFGWISEDGDFLSTPVDSWLDKDDTNSCAYLATSPDWEAEPDTDGLGFYAKFEAHIDGGDIPDIDDYTDMGSFSDFTTVYESVAYLTGTPESFTVEDDDILAPVAEATVPEPAPEPDPYNIEAETQRLSRIVKLYEELSEAGKAYIRSRIGGV